MSNETKDANRIDLSRRKLLKITVAGLLAGVAAPVFPYLSSTHAATGNDRKKVLIAYYSRTGSTREIANQIHERAGGDMIELQVAEPYPDDYEAVKNRAMQELNSDIKPALKTKVENIRYYDVIFVGSPIWWSTIAAPVKTFLSEYNLAEKTIIPFITHAGSGLGQSVTDISNLCPKSDISDSIAVWGRDAKTAQNKISEWLRKIKITK